MAIKALNGLGWYAAGLIVAPGCYLVSSMVAAERTHVEAVERAIATARKDIRQLETEFDTRANLAQLERWNGEVMRYTAPTPHQFLASDSALTSLRSLEGDGMAERYAAMVVPEGVPDAAPETAQVASASPAVAAAPVKAVAEKAIAGKVAAAVVVKAPAAPVTSKPQQIAAVAPKPAKPVVKTQREQAVAMLDRRLLKDSSFGDLMQGVRAEARRAR